MRLKPCLHYLCVGFILAATGCLQAGPGGDNVPTITFAPRPRLLYDAAGLALLRQTPDRAGEREAAVKRADDVLARGIRIPEKEGQWYFYYACPKDGAHLHAESDERHVCPTCHAVYTDERTCASWRTILNDQANQDCLELATAYALTSDVKYFTPAAQALLKLAKLYPTFGKHDRWGRSGLLAPTGGLRYCQLLDEATSVIKLAQVYDLLAVDARFSATETKTIEDGLLRYITGHIGTYQIFAGSRNNHQTWFNAAYANVAMATGDTELLRDAIWGKTGLLWQLDNSVTADGIWYEGTFSYHFYALAAIQSTLDAARRAGVTLHDNERLQSLWRGPLNMAWPDGSLPALHDGDPASLANYSGYFDWAARYFANPAFALQPATPNAAARSTAVLKDIGVAVLRRGSGDKAVSAMIDYGQHGGHHGHPDKLNLLLYARGQELLLDPGRITYSVPEYETWCRTTVAHNTVVVNEQNQDPTTGELWYVADTPQHAACLTATSGAYPGVLLRRFVVLTVNYCLDVVAVSSPNDAQFDLVTHLRGRLEFAGLTHPETGSLGNQAGYQHVTNIARLSLPAPAIGAPLAWLLPVTPPEATRDQALLTLFTADAPPPALFTGQGIGTRLNEIVPILLRRVKGKTACFVTVYDFSTADRIDGVDCDGTALLGAGNAELAPLTIHIRTKAATNAVTLDLRPPGPGGDENAERIRWK